MPTTALHKLASHPGPCALAESQSAKTPVLVLCDDLWHPAEIVRQGLAPQDDHGFDFVFLADGASWSASLMKAYPLVILAKSNVISADNKNPWLTAESQAEFKDWLQPGNGLLVLHSGTSGYQDLAVMRGLTGGFFLQHPDQCPVDILPRDGHPLTVGVSPFTVPDEHYFMSLDDDQADVFLQSRSPSGLQPAGWTRLAGRGRVCVLTPGHNLAVWLHPLFQTILGNALRWTAGHPEVAA